MAKRRGKSSGGESTRVESEQMSISVPRGTRAKLATEAKARRASMSGVVSAALDAWPFVSASDIASRTKPKKGKRVDRRK